MTFLKKSLFLSLMPVMTSTRMAWSAVMMIVHLSTRTWEVGNYLNISSFRTPEFVGDSQKTVIELPLANDPHRARPVTQTATILKCCLPESGYYSNPSRRPDQMFHDLQQREISCLTNRDPTHLKH